MRVLLTVSSWATHYAAMIPLGWALQAAGHDLRVLCAPSQAGPVSRAGLTPTPVLSGMEVPVFNRLQYYWEAVHGIWPRPWLPLHPITGSLMQELSDFDVDDYRRTREPRYREESWRSCDTAMDLARRWQPELILHDPASLEGPLLIGALGIPGALCLWGPVGTHEPDHMRIIPDDLSNAFERYGLPPFGPDSIASAIDPTPDSLHPPTKARRIAVRHVPFNGSAPVGPQLYDALKARPRVCVTWSTALSLMSGPRSFALPLVLQALSELDCEVIATATAEDVARLGRVPAGVRVLEQAPLKLLLPGCDAVVHHGGSGSIMTALWAGVPQLAVTFASEQEVAADRVTRAGAGQHVPGHLASEQAIQAAVSELLDKVDYRERAAELQEEMSLRPSLAELVETLEEMAYV